MSVILYKDIRACWEEATKDEKPRVSANGDLTYRMNHPDCPAGTDNRARLYMTEEAATGTILAYCHNCGGSGALRRNTDVTHITRSLGEPVLGTHDKPKLVADSELFAKFPKFDGTSGVPTSLQYLDPKEVRYFRRFDGFEWVGGIYIPSSDTFGADFIGYNCRMGEGSPQKYLKYLVPDYYEKYDTPPRSWFNTSLWVRTLVIVEDQVSAIKVAWRCGVASMALLGSSLTNTEILRISKNTEHVLVWLDNDGLTIEHEAKRIANMFRCLGVKADWVDTYTDPKTYDVPFISGVLNWYDIKHSTT